MTAAEVRAALDGGAVLLDLRTPRPFAREHVPRAVNLQFNRADLVDRAEMVLREGMRLVVHAEPEPIAAAAVELLRGAGFEVLGHLEGGLRAWKAAGLATAKTPVLDVDELNERQSEYQVVDAREGYEYRFAHIAGARPLPWTETWDRSGELPEGKPLAVVCGDEVRSAVAASILQRAGRDVALVLGGMTDWLERGYPTEKGAAPAGS